MLTGKTQQVTLCRHRKNSPTTPKSPQGERIPQQNLRGKGPPHSLCNTVASFRIWRGSRRKVGGPTLGPRPSVARRPRRVQLRKLEGPKACGIPTGWWRTLLGFFGVLRHQVSGLRWHNRQWLAESYLPRTRYRRYPILISVYLRSGLLAVRSETKSASDPLRRNHPNTELKAS